MDWRYKDHDGAFPEDAEAARAMLAKEFAEFKWWAQLASILADFTSDRMDECEKDAAWHTSQGRDQAASYAMMDMPAYKDIHRLAHLIKHVEMIHSARAIAEAVAARHRRPPRPGEKSAPIDVPTVDRNPLPGKGKEKR